MPHTQNPSRRCRADTGWREVSPAAAPPPAVPPISALHPSTWQYVSQAHIAYDYDRYFQDTELFQFDTRTALEWFDRPGDLIDLGCGTGRHLLAFCRRDFRVVGIDLNEHMLIMARTKLRQAHLADRARLIRADFCHLPVEPAGGGSYLTEGRYDYALCMFSTLGLIRGHRNRFAFLATVRRLLKPGGLLALHVHNRGANLFSHEGRIFLLKNAIWHRLGRGERGDKILPRYRGIRDMFIHVFSRREITDLLTESGFAVRRIIPLNRRRNGPLGPGRWSDLRANGFLLLAESPHR
ncbi:MAG: methyltransferase domain-containing protein [Sedimentisphaerales bacterium]|nr:methyltransferase domain-containing protein [Sedimentisphaerales bacterium]